MSDMRETDTQTGRSKRRRWVWRRFMVVAVIVLSLGIAYETLWNSGGDIREWWLSYQIERYIERNPHISQSDKIDLRAGRVVKGWNREKCRVAWGNPDFEFTITTTGMEIWQYGGATSPATLIYTSGVLTDFSR